jgi:hypothetical protein
MFRPDDREVPTIERCHLRGVMSPGDGDGDGDGDDRPVHGAHGNVAVPRDERCDPGPIGGDDRFGDQLAARQVPGASDLGIRAEPSLHEVGDFGDHQYGDDQRSGTTFEELRTVAWCRWSASVPAFRGAR